MTPNEAIPYLLIPEPVAIPAGFENLRMGPSQVPPLFACRVITEENYQKLGDELSQLLKDKEELLDALKTADDQVRFLISLNDASHLESVKAVSKRRKEIIQKHRP